MRNCNLTPLCVKCGEKHLSTSCSLPKKTNLPKEELETTRKLIRCANCSGQHTANYRGCPTRKNYIEKLETLKAKTQRPPSTTQPQILQTAPSTRYRTRQTTSDHPTSGSYAHILSSQVSNNSDLFTRAEFLALARELFNRLSNCRSKQQQFLAISELMIKYVYNA